MIVLMSNHTHAVHGSYERGTLLGLINLCDCFSHNLQLTERESPWFYPWDESVLKSKMIFLTETLKKIQNALKYMFFMKIYSKIKELQNTALIVIDTLLKCFYLGISAISILRPTSLSIKYA